MPKTPVIQEFARSADSDFSVFQWSWEGQTNLTIQTEGVRNPLGIRCRYRYQQWPSWNGKPLSPQDLAKSITATNVKLDNIEIILTRGGRTTTGVDSYAMQFARALGGEARVISYSSDVNQFPATFQQALSGLPEAITGDAPALSALADIPGWGTPGVGANGVVGVTRIVGTEQLPRNSRAGNEMQPYHVRAGKRPLGPQDAAGSLPKSARTEAAGRVRRDSARAAESDVEILGMFGL